MKKVYDVSVTLKSALHINGGTNPDGMRITIKSDGQAYIPATLFKGMVRENFEKLVYLMNKDNKVPYFKDISCKGKMEADQPCSCPVCTMFGKAGFQRSRIYFDNLETDQKLRYTIRANVAIDRYLQKARDKALVFSETVDTMAEIQDKGEEKKVPTSFSGQITVYLPETYGYEICACLEEAVSMIKSIGLGKSRGLGFVEVNISEAEGYV